MSAKKDDTQAVKKTAAKKQVKPDARSDSKSEAKSESKEKTEDSKTPRETRIFAVEALALARRLEADHLLVVCEDSTSLDELVSRGTKKKTIVASASERQRMRAEELGLNFESIPAYAFERFDKINIALAACASSGKLSDGQRVLCLVGAPGREEIDTCMLARVGQKTAEQSALAAVLAGSEYNPQLLDAVLQISLSVGFEGIEGDPVGTIFVVGDSTAVMEKSKQLTLNPFQGYSEGEKNILDPKIRDAIKNFCLLDGAFIIREDGVLLAAGRYLRAPEDLELDLPLGLGTRNAAAMAVTKFTKAIAFVISKTTGTVRIYKEGDLRAELKQPRRRT